jgi:signal transduction histidine kinase
MAFLRRPTRGPTWLASPLVQDAALALALAVLEVVSVLVAEADDSRHTPATGLLLLAASNLPLVYRRRFPAAVWGAVGLATAAYGWAPWTDPPVFAGALVAVFSVGAYASRRTGALVSAATAVVILVSWLADPVQHDLNDLLTPVLTYAGAWLVGALVAGERRSSELLRERAARLERDRDREAERVAGAERLRIARELHDITAHHVAVIAVHAEAGQSLLPDHPDAAATAFETIATSARVTLDDLRRMLGVLRRGDGPAPAPLGPQPGLSDLPRLVDQVRRTGLVVEVRMQDDGEADPPSLPEAVDLAAYRVVQEALTNVIRHARATTVRVTVRRVAGEVGIDVVDDGVGLPDGGPGGGPGGGGQGIVGMRERVELFGGALSLSAGAPDGGVAVHARIPVPAGGPLTIGVP